MLVFGFLVRGSTTRPISAWRAACCSASPGSASSRNAVRYFWTAAFWVCLLCGSYAVFLAHSITIILSKNSFNSAGTRGAIFLHSGIAASTIVPPARTAPKPQGPENDGGRVLGSTGWSWCCSGCVLWRAHAEGQSPTGEGPSPEPRRDQPDREPGSVILVAGAVNTVPPFAESLGARLRAAGFPNARVVVGTPRDLPRPRRGRADGGTRQPSRPTW